MKKHKRACARAGCLEISLETIHPGDCIRDLNELDPPKNRGWSGCVIMKLKQVFIFLVLVPSILVISVKIWYVTKTYNLLHIFRDETTTGKLKKRILVHARTQYLLLYFSRLATATNP